MRILCSFLFSLLFITMQAQTVTLKFSACDIDSLYLPLHHVVAVNWTQNWRTSIYWPDTVLVMQAGTGINDVEGNNNHMALQILQNSPNPFYGTTTVNINVPDPGNVSIDISDVNGRIVGTSQNLSLQKGLHQFRVTLSSEGVFFMTVHSNGAASSIKMVNLGNGGKNTIEYSDMVEFVQTSYMPKLTPKDTVTLPFLTGDQMSFIGYAEVNGIMMPSVLIEQAITTSQSFVMHFLISKYATDSQPCPGMMTCTDYDNNVYNTVWIGTQCWMKENMRTTHYSDGNFIEVNIPCSVNSTTASRYAPNNDESNVHLYGYLYNWSAVMHGVASSNTNPSGVQGVCPDGWHVPSDLEWTILTDYVKSRSQYVCGDDTSFIAKSLADTLGWNVDDGECCVGNNLLINNSLCFSALPAGYYSQSSFCDYGNFADFWCATGLQDYTAYGRYVGYNTPIVGENIAFKNNAFSVRCVRD